MNVALSATGSTLAATVDPRFGRSARFIVVETDDLSFEAVENEAGSLGGGAGIQAARLLAEKQVKVVLTGNCGPNAYQTLNAAGIEVVVGCSGTVSEVVARFKAGELRPAGAPNVQEHAGLGRRR